MRAIPLFLMLAGCATAAPVNIAATFNPSEVAWFNVDGSNTIRGSAVLRTVAGNAKTCAGLSVELIPVSTYATERMLAIYGNSSGGFARSAPTFASTNADYYNTRRSTRCDPEGRFRFTGVPDGDYYVTTSVVWGIYNGYFTQTEGGALMRRVRVSGGEQAEIVLTAS